MEGNGGQVRAEGTAISSTASDDVDMMDGQDQETVAGSGTHLGGLVAQKRTKVKNSNASEKVTADVLARRILDYGIVKAEKATNVVWHYFRKFCPKKLAAKRPAMDPLRLQDHALCMLCMESKDQERREHVTVKLGKCKSPTAMVDHMQKYHKEEWVELHKAGQWQQSMKSFSAQHSPKKAQSLPAEGSSGTAHAALEIGAVERADSSSGAAAHAASTARFAHLKDIFAPQETTKAATTEGAQGKMLNHFLTLVWCSCLMSRSTKKKQCG